MTTPTTIAEAIEELTKVRTPIVVERGIWRGNVIRRARKGSRCDYWHGSAIGKCKHRIEPGDLYLEGEMNDTAGGYGCDRYCMNCVAGHEGISASLDTARAALGGSNGK